MHAQKRTLASSNRRCKKRQTGEVVGNRTVGHALLDASDAATALSYSRLFR